MIDLEELITHLTYIKSLLSEDKKESALILLEMKIKSLKISLESSNVKETIKNLKS